MSTRSRFVKRVRRRLSRIVGDGFGVVQVIRDEEGCTWIHLQRGREVYVWYLHYPRPRLRRCGRWPWDLGCILRGLEQNNAGACASFEQLVEEAGSSFFRYLDNTRVE